MLTDLRFALRSLLKAPGFALVTVLTLALGIGTTTTVFSWIERVLLNPLPGVVKSDRLVALETRGPSGDLMDTSYPDFRDFQARTNNLTGILVFKERPLNLGEGESAQRVWSQLVSGNFFELLGVHPQLGRFFAAADQADEPAAAPVVVISETLWRRHFAADPGILGRTIKLNRHDFTVIGVAPANFLGSLNGLAFEVWVPLWQHPQLLGASPWLETRGWRALHTLGRLAPGATIDSARAELTGLAAQLAAAHPDTNQGISLMALSLARSPHGAQSVLALPLMLLLGVCGLLLVIVCANVSNLLLVRASARQRELCIRQALGAGWLRLAGQLLSESFLLSLAGTLLGLLFTAWLSEALNFFIPDATLPISLTARFSPTVWLLATGLCAGTALVAGFASFLWSARPNLMDVLRGRGGAAALSRRAERFRGTLVITQVATAFVTLACTAVAMKSFQAARQARPGFDPSGVLLAGIKLDTSGYHREQGLDFLERQQQRLAVMPGVEAAALAENVPLGLSRGSWDTVKPEGYVPTAQEDMRIYRNLISPGYFSLMRIPLLAGRDFTADDRAGNPSVAIVSETFARRYFGTRDAVGRVFAIWGGTRKLTVVAVVGDIKIHSLSEAPLPYYYVPLRQFFSSDTGIAVHLRTRGEPLALLPSLRHEVRAVDPNVPVFEALTLEDFISAARFAQRIAASVLGVLSGIALVLTSLGLYGVLAFAVAQRTAEIGVRLALGAQPGDIARLVLTRGGRLVLAGLAVGSLAALSVTRLLATYFYGVKSFEPGLFALVVPAVVLAALVACWLPARRATQVDPMVALRAE